MLICSGMDGAGTQLSQVGPFVTLAQKQKEPMEPGGVVLALMLLKAGHGESDAFPGCAHEFPAAGSPCQSMSASDCGNGLLERCRLRHSAQP